MIPLWVLILWVTYYSRGVGALPRVVRLRSVGLCSPRVKRGKFFILKGSGIALMDLCESVMEVLLVSRACRSRPMAMDLATSPEMPP